MSMSNSGNVQIRPARAEDVDAALPLIYSSGPLVWDFLFGDGTPESSMPFLRKGWLSGKGVAGYKWHWLAEVDGQVLGSISVYSGVEYGQLSNQTGLQVLRHFGFGCFVRFARLIKFGKHLMLAPRKNVDYVANLGVAEASRSLGVGRALLNHFEERAVERGKRYYELDVVVTNPRAQALYERCGMVVCKERSYEPFSKQGLPATRRMRKALTPAV